MQLAGKGVNNCTISVGSDFNMMGRCKVQVAHIGLAVNEV